MRKNTLLLVAMVALNATAYCSADSAQFAFDFIIEDEIRIFFECLAITNAPAGGVLANTELFARKFEKLTASALPFANMSKRNRSKDCLELSFSYDSNGKSNEVSTLIGVCRDEEHASKTMLSQIVFNTMGAMQTAKRFVKLESAQSELLLLENRPDRDGRERKVIHWCGGNVFAVIQAEAGVEKAFEILNMVRESVKSSNETTTGAKQLN